jgi:hypothetical protein
MYLKGYMKQFLNACPSSDTPKNVTRTFRNNVTVTFRTNMRVPGGMFQAQKGGLKIES